LNYSLNHPWIEVNHWIQHYFLDRIVHLDPPMIKKKDAVTTKRYRIFATYNDAVVIVGTPQA